MTRRLGAAAGEDRSALPDHETLTGYIRRWEAGRTGVSERYELLISKVFGTNRAEAEIAVPTPQADQIDDALALIELNRQAEHSDLGQGTLEALCEVKERLCREYPSESAGNLAERGTGYLRYIFGLLDGQVNLAQHRDLLVIGGWLSALLSCLHYDLGNSGAAEAARVMARNVGKQTGHNEIVGWSYEIAAWFALVENRYADVVKWAQAGLGKVGRTDATVQLSLQAARGYAHLGDDRAIDALRTGRRILDTLPEPEYPEHHFSVDHDKFDFYAGTVWTLLGKDDAAAAKHARLAAAKCILPSGRIRWPMRLAISKLDLAIIASRRGDLDEAVAFGTAALQIPRRSAQLLPRAAEFGHRLAARYPREHLVCEYRDMIHNAHQSLPPLGSQVEIIRPHSTTCAMGAESRRGRRFPQHRR